MEALLSKLDEMGVKMDVDIDSVTIYRSEHLKPIDIKTAPYPGFATDLQQPLTPLMCKCEGQSSIKETIYPERFKHCVELQRMGADIDIRTGSALVNGPIALFGDDVVATDLRCGASLIIAGLMAEGVTRIHEIYHIDRGYANIDAKLRSLGAHIDRVEIDE